LEQVASEYEANLRRWDTGWKNKLVEINARIIRFQTDGSVLVGQDEYKQGAVCFFTDSENSKLAKYDQGSVIKVIVE
jgi:D-serine dehydratase